MKKKFGIVLLTVALTVSCLLGLCACNGRSGGDDLVLRTGSRPNHSSIISQNDLEIINTALSDGATEEDKKTAVMALYDIANYSRQNTELSLMLQSSDAGIDLGDVIMHGFNLKNGDKWYYQLATEATSPDEGWSMLLGNIAGLLKVAYTSGDGNYYYTVIPGGEPQCNCKVETFPFASFIVTREPVLYNEEAFKKELHYLNGMHEINNMKFSKDIIADGAEITYNADERFYTVKFSVDMEADSELLQEWFALPKEDMAVGGQTLKGYIYYNAVLEVWDNGYAKSFQSTSSRDAGYFASGKPSDKFEYLWNENEILELLEEDESIDSLVKAGLNSVDDYIDYYSNPELVSAKLGKLAIIGIAVGSVIGAIVIAIIVTVIVIEVLLKKGKLPKLAAKREAKKQKKLAKREAAKQKRLEKNAPKEGEEKTKDDGEADTKDSAEDTSADVNDDNKPEETVQ